MTIFSIITLSDPFSEYPDARRACRAAECGVRPQFPETLLHPLPDSYMSRLRTVLNTMWAGDALQRPTALDVHKTIERMPFDVPVMRMVWATAKCRFVVDMCNPCESGTCTAVPMIAHKRFCYAFLSSPSPGGREEGHISVTPGLGADNVIGPGSSVAGGKAAVHLQSV